MAKTDPYIGPIGNNVYTRAAVGLSASEPGYNCSASSVSFSIRPGLNSALVFFDLGDGDLTKCEVEWALSQVRRLRLNGWLPNLPEHAILGGSFYNASYENCYMYTHPDHRAVHEAVWQTDFGTAGAQFGRTCRSDPDQVRVDYVDQYTQLMGLSGETRVGAAQVYYGWLWAGAWDVSAHDDGAFAPANQAFWSRF